MMPLLGYTLPGADAMILSGEKTSTVRLGDYDKCRKWESYRERGMPIRHYMNPRTKDMRLIAVTPIGSVDLFRFPRNRKDMPADIARMDGFDTVDAMYCWFLRTYGSTLFDRTFLRITWAPPGRIVSGGI